MALVRMIVIGLLCACRADASSGSGIKPPIGWRAQPEIAGAVASAAKTSHLTVDTEAWAEPAMGCYGVWIAMHGPGSSLDDMAQKALDSFGRDVKGITISNIVMPSAPATPNEGADQGVLAFSFKQATYEGRARARLARDGHVTALACFWNEREPKQCETACSSLLEKLP